MGGIPPVQPNQNVTPLPANTGNGGTVAAQSQPVTPAPAAPTTGEVNGRPLAFYERTFFALNNTLFRSELQFGVLPLNNDFGRLLLSGFIMEQRESAPDSFYHLDHQHLDYAFEPQLQVHLGNNWELYFRTPVTFHNGYGDTQQSTDLLADLTVGHNWSDQLIRLEYGANNMGNDGQPYQYVTATPYYRFHLYQDYLMLRLGAKYSHYFGQTDTDILSFEAKLEGTINSDPWSGWGVQAFVPVILNPDLQSGQRRVELSGIYAWMGSVLPPSWLGRGFFVEGGIWIGGHIDESDHPGQDLAAGVNIKIKYGTEARWWQ